MFLLFLLPIFSQFSPFSRNEKGEHHFIVHSDAFYTASFSQNTCTLDFIQNMAEQSAESYVSLYGNHKANSILQNVKKKMVVLKNHTYCRKTFR